MLLRRDPSVVGDSHRRVEQRPPVAVGERRQPDEVEDRGKHVQEAHRPADDAGIDNDAVGAVALGFHKRNNRLKFIDAFRPDCRPGNQFFQFAGSVRGATGLVDGLSYTKNGRTP